MVFIFILEIQKHSQGCVDLLIPALSDFGGFNKFTHQGLLQLNYFLDK